MFASADPFSCAKVLIFVALFTWSTTSVVTAGSMLPEGTPTSYASDAMNAADVLGLRQNFTNVVMTENKHTDEERGYKPLAAGLVRGKTLDTFVKNFRATYGFSKDAGFSGLRNSASNDNFFKSPSFLQWAASVKSKFGDSSEAQNEALHAIFVMLAEILERDFVGTIVREARMESTEDIASKLLNMLLEVWVRDKRSPKAVFRVLLPDWKTDNLFANPFFCKLETFFKLSHPDDLTKADKEMLMFLEQIKYFRRNNKLVSYLVEGATMEKTGPIADRLLDVQVGIWIKEEAKPMEEVFHLLHLDRTQGLLGKNPIFYKWDLYADSTLPQLSFEQKFVAKLDFLKHRCTEDDLASVLVPGIAIDRLRPIASAMLDVHVNRWKQDSSKGMEEVFDLLQLDQPRGKLGKNPLINKWDEFADSRLPEKLSYVGKYEKKLDFLKHHCTEENLVSVLVPGIAIDRLRPIASATLHDHVNRWIKDKSKNMKEVFDLLQLDETQGKLGRNPLLYEWAVFADSALPKELPFEDKYVEMINFVESHCSFEDVVSFLVLGTTGEFTRLIAYERLVNLIKWRIKDPLMDAETIFKLLELDWTQGELSHNPLYSTWVAFVKSKNPTTWHTKIPEITKKFKPE